MATTDPALGLPAREAVPLLCALVHHVAQTHGVRVLAIKGPVARLQELRTEKVSVDVDVLVDPAGLDALLTALDAIGWENRNHYDFAAIVPHHSVNRSHPAWPCEIDLHHWFPGFLASPDTVFDALWARRVVVDVAGQPLTAPDRVGHAALLALNHLRDLGDASNRQKLLELEQRVCRWAEADLAELSQVAASTGAAHSLSPFLLAVGSSLPENLVPLSVSEDDWSMQSVVGTRAIIPWLIELGRLRWHRRPFYVLRAVWHGDQVIRTMDMSHPHARRSRRRAKVARLVRAVRGLPAAVAELHRLERRSGAPR